ncbi:hypothetical protein AC578_592 [Pseudocercospora eumusae]|uniref:N-acetyltransferase domain-containing protein n=1 Tax=Pseudocercospora eumusae TaxID=321146 RepID=A0A139HFF7_9PEZI|nr:hypothetical protein AC578_592 [Pseudocercospora eumusae]
MPRDLSSLVNEHTLSGMSGLSRVGDDDDDEQDTERAGPMDAHDEHDDDNDSIVTELSQRNEKRDELHPYTQTLSLSDVESCVRLEEATFPPQERCTREKFQYRLTLCGHLSMGIFTSQEGDSNTTTAATAQPVYSGAPERKSVLMGHIVATKTTSLTVTDSDMAIPTPDNPDPKLGHKEEGRTVCIHSLAVLPEYQKRGLGQTLMKAYLQRIESHGVADRAALIAHEHLIPYYEKLGFENKGPSKAQFGGGGWFDMIKELHPENALSP